MIIYKKSPSDISGGDFFQMIIRKKLALFNTFNML